jgi:hypothetical protein
MADPNPGSLEVLRDCRSSQRLPHADRRGGAVRAARLFCADPDSAPGKPVFNRTVGLRTPFETAGQSAGQRCREGEDNSMQFGAAMFFTDASMTPANSAALEQRVSSRLGAEHACSAGAHPRRSRRSRTAAAVLRRVTVPGAHRRGGGDAEGRHRRLPDQPARSIQAARSWLPRSTSCRAAAPCSASAMAEQGGNGTPRHQLETRHKLSRERIGAMKAIWSRDTAEPTAN